MRSCVSLYERSSSSINSSKSAISVRVERVADPVTAAPEEARPFVAPPSRTGVVHLLRRPGFRRVYLAVAASELGDAFQYIALMWAALLAGGPLGMIAVRLADSVPALVFGFHGGVLADRVGRRRLMVTADLVRAAALVPIAVAGLTGSLPLWSLVVVAFVLTTCASYFDPAYGAVLPSLAGRDGVQAANALVRSSADALGSIGVGALLARRPVARKARASLFAWVMYLPAYLLLALAHSLGPALAGAVAAGAGQGAALVLTLSAVQSEIPDSHLGRVTGLVSIVHRGAHATGLLLVSPLFAVVAARSVFAGAALAIPLVGLASAAVAARARPSPRPG